MANEINLWNRFLPLFSPQKKIQSPFFFCNLNSEDKTTHKKPKVFFAENKGKEIKL